MSPHTPRAWAPRQQPPAPRPALDAFGKPREPFLSAALVLALLAAWPPRSRSCCSAAQAQAPDDRPARCSSRSPPTPDLGLEVRASASCCCCSSTRWATSSSCGARASRPARRCSSRSWAPSSGPSRWAATRSPRRASASPARCSARSAPRPASPLYAATDNDLFRALAFTGFFLNLFNLLPVVPLDGGRAMAAMAPWMWLLGLVRRWSRSCSPSPTRSSS